MHKKSVAQQGSSLGCLLSGQIVYGWLWPAADVQRPVQLPSPAEQVGRVAQRNPALHDRPHPCPMRSN